MDEAKKQDNGEKNSHLLPFFASATIEALTASRADLTGGDFQHGNQPVGEKGLRLRLNSRSHGENCD